MANRSPEIHHNDVMVALSHELGCDPGYLELVSWNLKSLMEDGKLGYGGDHFQLAGVVKVALGPQQAETTSFNKSTTRDFSFFVKALPGDNPEQRERLREGLQKESLFYTLLAQDLADALGSKELLYPSCVLAKGDCLIVQDLGAMRFRCCDSRLLDLEHTKLVVRAMARQHAGSLILEERHGARLDQLFPELLRDSTNYSKEPGLANADWHRASFKVAVDIVPHLDKYRGNAELVARIQAQLPALLTQAFPGLQPWPDARNAVVHADLWTNNVMFRYDGVGSCGVLPVPVEVALVDFQLVRYTPPAHDLVTFLLYCTDKDFQERHFHELARLHWDCMAAELRGVALDPDKVLSWPEFQRTLEPMWRVGLLEMALEQPLVLVPRQLMESVLADPQRSHRHFLVDRSDTIIQVYQEDAFFRARYTETMERIIDNFILGDGQMTAV